jgi:pSer/pThr/pTyr-binding forkhead associated (FHA) protein
MPLTVLLAGLDERALTFDGARVVIGRGAGCDVRLPDTSVSHRHASVRANGGVYSLVDEGSANGTFVGKTRLPPQVPHTLRSGDRVRVGKVWLELRTDQQPATVDLGLATRELALSLVSRRLQAQGKDVTARVLVVEGRTAGAELALAEEERAYVAGHGDGIDLPLDADDASPESLRVTRRGSVVTVRDLGTANGMFLGDALMRPGVDVIWKPQAELRVGRTILALREPLADALAELEAAPDEPLAAADVPPFPEETPPAPPVAASEPEPKPVTAPPPKPRRPRVTTTDVLVMLLALLVICASIAGLTWLLKS